MHDVLSLLDALAREHGWDDRAITIRQCLARNLCECGHEAADHHPPEEPDDELQPCWVGATEWPDGRGVSADMHCDDFRPLAERSDEK